MKNAIRLYAILPRTRALGPFTRFSLWVQGCRRGCPGCMTADAQSMDGGRRVAVETLAKEIAATPGIEGVTISGGEPFLQAPPLAALIRKARMIGDLGVILYTGYTLEALRGETEEAAPPGAAELLNRIDLLIDGPYIREQDDGRSLRGSANQRLHFLTDRYAEVAADYYGKEKRRVEVHTFADGLFLAGIPGAETLAEWRRKKQP